MKKILIIGLLLLIALSTYGQNKFKYAVNANGGLRVGGDDHNLIDSVKLVTGDVVIYIGGVAYVASGATIVDVRGEIEDSLNVLRPLVVMVADTGTMLIPYINRADTSGMLVNYILTSEANAAYANKALSNLASVAINTHLLPATSGSANLGSGALPFGKIFGTATQISKLTLGDSTSNTVMPIDSIGEVDSKYAVYKGADTVDPHITAAGRQELTDVAIMLSDTTHTNGLHILYTQWQIDSIAALKANIASPTFTDTPAAPTASVGTNTTQIATTAFVLANRGYDEWDALYDSLNSDIITQSLGVSIVDANNLSNDLTDGTAYYQAVYINEPCTVTGIKFMSADNGSFMQDNYNEVALYSFANDTIYQIAVSANDSTKWETASGGVIDFPFTTPEVITVPGIYYVGFIYNSSAATTTPELVSITNTIGMVIKVGFCQTGQTELAAKKRVSTGTNVVALWWFALYYTP